jgi:hypothetical protein
MRPEATGQRGDARVTVGERNDLRVLGTEAPRPGPSRARHRAPTKVRGRSVSVSGVEAAGAVNAQGSALAVVATPCSST